MKGKEKKFGDCLFANNVVRSYPQTILTVKINEGNFIDEKLRHCLQCNTSYAPLRFPERNKRNHFSLGFSFCSSACIKRYILMQRTLIPSINLVSLGSYMRDIFKYKSLEYPAAPLYALQPYQWIPLETCKTLSPQEYAESGYQLFMLYSTLEGKDAFPSEDQLWDHIINVREKVTKGEHIGQPILVSTLKQKKKTSDLSNAFPSPPKFRYDSEEILKRKTKYSENMQAIIERCHIRNSSVLKLSVCTSFLLQLYEQCAFLPFWMQWRIIDAISEYPTLHAEFFSRFQTSGSEKSQSRTRELQKLWNLSYLPKYTNDEWEQLCPNENALHRYKQLATRQRVLSDKTLILCYYCHNAIHDHPFFRPLVYYPPFDKFVFDTKVVYCSPSCCKTWLHEQREVRYQDELIPLQECVCSRWNFSWAVQCAPPISILPCFSNFKILSDQSSNSTSSFSYPKQKSQKGEYEFEILRYLLAGENQCIPPRNYEEFNLCISLGSTVFRWIFPPFSTEKCILFPTKDDIYFKGP